MLSHEDPKNIHVAIIFNEPTLQTPQGRKFVNESGKIGTNLSYERAKIFGSIDLSEIGVVEQQQNVQSALKFLGYATSVFNASNDVAKLVEFIRAANADIIFNMVESIGDKAIHEMHIAGIFELLGIPYTGSSPLVLGICLNKARTKEILSYHGLPTPHFLICHRIADLHQKSFPLRFPIISKPAKEDASVGIDNYSVVSSFDALCERTKYIIDKYDQPAILEEYIEGRELNLAVIGNHSPCVLPISEIDFSGLPAGLPKIVTYDAKWMSGSAEYKGTVGICPADIPEATAEIARNLALQAYSIMGCRDYARVDMRLSSTFQPYIIEVNPNPDISIDSGFIRSSKASGLTFNEIIGKILEFGLARSKRK